MRNTASRLKERFTAAQMIDQVDAQAQWQRYLDSPDDKTSLDAWKYLNDRVYGKAKQTTVLEGDVDKPVAMRVEIIHIGGK